MDNNDRIFLVVILILLALAIAPKRAHGAEPAPEAAAPKAPWLVLTVGSRHHKRGYNEHNWGLGIEAPMSERTRFLAGYYQNSFDRRTIYAGAGWCAFKAPDFLISGADLCLGGMAGMFSGYDRKPVFLAAPVISYEYKNKIGLNIGPILPTVVGFQVKARF